MEMSSSDLRHCAASAQLTVATCRDHITTTSRPSTFRSVPPRLTAWIWCAVLVVMFCSASCTAESPTLQPTATTYSPKPPVFNIIDCKNSFESYEQKIWICSKRPDLFPILTYAEQVAKSACEEEFKNERWNCSNFSLLKQPAVIKGDKIFRESAYVYALSLAVITHTVIKGCSQNVIANCSCSGNSTVCPSSVEYALKISDTFLHQRYASTGGGFKQQIAQHNFIATKELIYEIMNSTEHRQCRCHGISGSCTFSTCYNQLPDFSVLARRLKRAYKESCRVVASGASRITWKEDCGRTPGTTDFVHTADNNWCVVNPDVGSLGVSGRECSPYPDAPNACAKLCATCGRGSKEHIYEKVSKCDCSFHFCCEIKCKTCTEQKTSFRCS